MIHPRSFMDSPSVQSNGQMDESSQVALPPTEHPRNDMFGANLSANQHHRYASPTSHSQSAAPLWTRGMLPCLHERHFVTFFYRFRLQLVASCASICIFTSGCSHYGVNNQRYSYTELGPFLVPSVHSRFSETVKRINVKCCGEVPMHHISMRFLFFSKC